MAHGSTGIHAQTIREIGQKIEPNSSIAEICR